MKLTKKISLLSLLSGILVSQLAIADVSILPIKIPDGLNYEAGGFVDDYGSITLGEDASNQLKEFFGIKKKKSCLKRFFGLNNEKHLMNLSCPVAEKCKLGILSNGDLTASTPRALSGSRVSYGVGQLSITTNPNDLSYREVRLYGAGVEAIMDIASKTRAGEDTYRNLRYIESGHIYCQQPISKQIAPTHETYCAFKVFKSGETLAATRP